MASIASDNTSSPFYIPVDLSHTALLLSDVQIQILARFPEETQKAYLEQILKLLAFFRSAQGQARCAPNATKQSLYDEVPLIVHHTLAFGVNNNAYISPYNKLASWVRMLEVKGYFNDSNSTTSPERPFYGVPEALLPSTGWSKDEIVLPKLQPNSFASSDMLAYLRARGIRHVVLVGLTTMGSILGSARGGADLDFHVIVVKGGVMEDVGNEDVHDILMNRVLPKFVDVVDLEDVFGLRM